MPSKAHHILRSDAENMEVFLDYLDNNYQGQASSYLISIGISESEIDALRGRILEE